MIDDPIIAKLKEWGEPVTRSAWISLNFFGTPPDQLSAEDEADVPDYPWDP